jgi:hypothetical protein
VEDLSFSLHVGEHGELVLHRYDGVDAVEVVQVDPFDLEPSEAHLDALAEVLRPSAWCPPVGSLAGETAFGGDDELARVGVQRLADVFLCGEWAVGVGGVDVRDASVDGVAKDLHGLFGIVRRCPMAGAGQLHRAVPEATCGLLAYREDVGGEVAVVISHRPVPLGVSEHSGRIASFDRPEAGAR